jgi:hypothetical protein
MAKLKIAENPTFTADVEIPRVGGTSIKVQFTFKYRNREELAALFDRWQADTKERFKGVGEGSTLAAATAAEVDQQVSQMLEVVEAWGFDDPFDEENVRALVLSIRGATDAVLNAYGAAYQDARRGN